MKSFVDFDKELKKIYLNYYSKSLKKVIKIPLINSNNESREILVDEFNLSNRIYLVHIE